MKDYYLWFLVLFILAAGCVISYRTGYAAGRSECVRFVYCHDGQCQIVDPACVDPAIRAQFEGGK
ncbi:MAG: hypothetical protein ABSG90_07830 [Dehalococcoidia bacterium]|jgi:hypothetical protein